MAGAHQGLLWKSERRERSPRRACLAEPLEMLPVSIRNAMTGEQLHLLLSIQPAKELDIGDLFLARQS